MTFKQKIHAHYQQLVQDRIDAFRDMISALADDAQNDAKGSAGDKHETALSMMHIEQEKFTQKLKEFIDQKAVLDRIDAEASLSKVVLGSLVKANESYLFVSSALPKITIGNVAVIALSPQSPLGNKLIGKEVGDSFEISGTVYTINAIS